MKLPIQIVFHNQPHSDPIEAMIRKEAAKLDSFYDRIMRCKVVVDIPHRHHTAGNPYSVRIDITVPGEEIAVNREPSLRSAQQNVDAEDWSKAVEAGTARKHAGVAVREAFATARRLLQDYARRHRGQVKLHAREPHARVSRLFPDKRYGLLLTPDGREIYFHKSSVLNKGFNRLEVGTEVSFVEEQGEKGPQASTVRRLA
ncbi:MAG TPA: HPF/RaiA family ribosome-associated protein [Blastocatellia bacterium]|nr:HPF/RaiA family ribosome-associated protein [Blastocatellia bacterium]